MDLHVHLCAGRDCAVTIEDKTEEANLGYFPEIVDAISLHRFKFLDTCSIIALQHNKTEGPELKKTLFFPHGNLRQEMEVPIDFDGWFTIYYIVLPTKKWFESLKRREPEFLEHCLETIYFTDGKSIYKYSNNKVEKVGVEEVANRNECNTTISRVVKNYVSICLLKKCYISLCQQLFSRGFSPCFNKVPDNELSYKRDLVWMAINVIKYMTQLEQLAEAQRMIERFGGCSGICSEVLPNRSISGGCGCGK